MVTFDEFMKIEIRAGRVIDVVEFERARKPTYKVQVDFGPEVGIKWSSLQAKAEYTREEMLGRFVVAVVNFPPKNIAGFMSEALVLGVPAEDGSLSILEPSRGARLGGRVY